MEISDTLVTVEDVIGWLHCPLAYASGYKPSTPHGDTSLAARLVKEWPAKKTSLGKISRSSSQASTWMHTTLYAINHHKHGTPALPPPAHHGDYWVGNTGYFTIDSVFQNNITVKFDLHGLSKCNNVWEILYIDTHPDPPDFARHCDMIMEAGFLSDCFRHMTGIHAGVRLIAPGYEREEMVNIPQQHSGILIKFLEIAKTFAIARPGSHCNSTKSGNKRLSKKWCCPVRESGNCNPFF